MTTHYDVLGISRNATGDQIKKAYHKLALKNHPDKNPSKQANSAFQAIQASYEVLKDPSTRKEYDLSLKPIPTSKPMPTPYTAPKANSDAQAKLHPEKLSQDLVDVIDSDSSRLFAPYLNRYTDMELDAVLIRACKMGKCEIARDIIQKYPYLAMIQIDHFGIKGNLLFLAAASGNVKLVDLLIQHKVLTWVEGSTREGLRVNALYFAVAGKHLEIVRRLCEKVSPVLCESIYQLALDHEDPEIVYELLKKKVHHEYFWISNLMKKQSLPLVQALKKHIGIKVRDEWISLVTFVLPYFDLKKIQELILYKEFDPFEILFQGEEYRDALVRLFTAIGRSRDIERLKWFASQYEQVSQGLLDAQLLDSLLLGALELNSPFHIDRRIDREVQFQFCRKLLEIVKPNSLSREIQKIVYTCGAKFSALFYMHRVDKSIRESLERYIDLGVQELEWGDLYSLFQFVANDKQAARDLYSLREPLKLELIKRGHGHML